MFIGREQELIYLDKKFKSKKAEFVVLYGRRRVGKTELLTQFCKNIPHIYYLCREYSDEKQLMEFSKALMAFDEKYRKAPKIFSSWEEAFSFLAELAADKKIVLVIDEFPYMAKANKSIPSILQIAWDTLLKNSKIMLVLSGSSMSFIKDEILASKNPLYGRTTGIYKMLPLPYQDAIKFVPSYSEEEKLMTYAILGGIPYYLACFDPDKSLQENIIDEILTKGGSLYSEVEFLIHQEMREASVYNTIIEAIALGNTSFNDLSTKTRMESSKLSVYLKNLIALGLVVREFPVLASEKEKAGAGRGLYQLTDNFFRFYYAFCYPHLDLLERGDSEEVYQSLILPNLHHFCGKSFENICIDYLYLLNSKKRLPFYFHHIGRWWGKVTHKEENGKLSTTNEEIDILASDNNQTEYLIGECKFTNAPFDLQELKKFQAKWTSSTKTTYYLFSLNGFTDAVKEEQKKQKDLVLVTGKDLLSLS